MDECAGVMRAFLRGGPGGAGRLRAVWRTLRAHFHAGDEQGWARSCEAAFSGYEGGSLRARGWDLGNLDPELFG